MEVGVKKELQPAVLAFNWGYEKTDQLSGSK